MHKRKDSVQLPHRWHGVKQALWMSLDGLAARLPYHENSAT